MSLKVSQLLQNHFLLQIFFLTKIDKKTQLKMKVTSGNSKHKHVTVEANLFLQALDRNFDHLQTNNDCHNLQLFTFIDKTFRETFLCDIEGGSNLNDAPRKFYLQVWDLHAWKCKIQLQ